jgi:hypothetical protein
MIDHNDPDNFCPLDEETAALFAEMQEQVKLLNAQAQGMLRLYLRQHHLDGEWRIAENGRELRRVGEAQHESARVRQSDE